MNSQTIGAGAGVCGFAVLSGVAFMRRFPLWARVTSAGMAAAAAAGSALLIYREVKEVDEDAAASEASRREDSAAPAGSESDDGSESVAQIPSELARLVALMMRRQPAADLLAAAELPEPVTREQLSEQHFTARSWCWGRQNQDGAFLAVRRGEDGSELFFADASTRKCRVFSLADHQVLQSERPYVDDDFINLFQRHRPGSATPVRRSVQGPIDPAAVSSAGDA